jgi:polar amino acid transport system substrate-binding protein
MNNYKFLRTLNRTALFPLLVLAFISFSYELSATEKLVFNSGASSPYTSKDGSGFHERIVREIFHRLNIEAETIYLPAERSLINANKGIEDGVIGRIKGIEKKYPNLVRVPEKIVDYEFVAYANKTDISVEGWESFKPYEVAYIKGWEILEANIPNAKRIYKVKGPRQLFGLLRNNRVEVVVYERWAALWWNRELKTGAKCIEPPIAKREMFIYLHKNHTNLIPKVARTLYDMKKDGAYQRIFDQTLLALLN